jgi:hypothetical protein
MTQRPFDLHAIQKKKKKKKAFVDSETVYEAARKRTMQTLMSETV